MQDHEIPGGSGDRRIRLLGTAGSGRHAIVENEELKSTWVSPHALDRLREHHPRIGVRGALALLQRSTEVEPGFAAPLLGRPLEKVRDRYFFSADRRGVFVIARSFRGFSFAWAMVTYLRLGQRQHDIAACPPRCRMRRLLLTGSAGVIGRALYPSLRAAGFDVRGFDRASDARQEILDTEALHDALAGCAGVIHLAACSRVGRADARPAVAKRDNEAAVEALTKAITSRADPPWLLFTSSREVYGDPARLPADETTPIEPVNVYGRTKVAGEEMVSRARAAGVKAAIVRLTNVYGAPRDHSDRLIPSLTRAALRGLPLHVRGSGRTMDLIHIDDVVRGTMDVALLLDQGTSDLPPMNLCSGRAVEMGDLAHLVVAMANSTSPVRAEETPPREVLHFVGDPRLAGRVLGWRPQVSLQAGLGRLVPCSSVSLEVFQ